MSKRITLENDEVQLIRELLKRALGQESVMSKDLASLASVAATRLFVKLGDVQQP